MGDCAACGFVNPPGFKYCGQCGIPLDGGLARREPAAEAKKPRAERRLLTVVFCDLVGSTALADRLDIEELREVVGAYQRAATKTVEDFSGHIAQYLGDGLLIYFGYPQAHEGDAQRAVHAGLGILRAMDELNERLQGERGLRLAVRVGIHTGPVVAGEVGAGARRETLAVGQTPNVAARLQSLADPDTAVVSESTYNLTRGFFSFESLGTRRFKGISQPMEIYRAKGASGIHSRFELALNRGGLSPLVGREAELEVLRRRFEQSCSGQSQAVAVSGEAGIGKSHLVERFKEELEAAGHDWLICRSSAYGQSSAFYPVIGLLERRLQIGRDGDPETRLVELGRGLERLGFEHLEGPTLIAALLSLPVPPPPLTESPRRRKEKTLEVVVELVLHLAAGRGLAFVVEDLHWIDPSTLELLDLLFQRSAGSRVFLLLTFRPEFELVWEVGPRLTRVDLENLDEHDARCLVEHLVGERRLSPAVVNQLVEKSDGVPLFIEEMTWELTRSEQLSGDDTAAPDLAVPTTLQDLLLARLDRLGAAREVALLAAVLGRDFSFELLAAVSPWRESALEEALDQLSEAGLLFPRGPLSERQYYFKHALIQEAAYRLLLRRERQQHHGRVAEILERRFPQVAARQPELLAHHYTAAGLGDRAIEHWHAAGRRAATRAAHVEALRHLEKALELLAEQPESAARDRRELELRISLGSTMMAARGFGAPEVEQIYARALEVCRRSGEDGLLFPVVSGLLRFYSARSQYATAHELGEQLVRLADKGGKPEFRLEAHRMLGACQCQMGRFESADLHLIEALEIYRARHRENLETFLELQPGVFCLFCAGYAKWHLGFPDKALKLCRDALELARRLAFPLLLVAARMALSIVHQYREEERETLSEARAVLELARKHGFPDWQQMAAVFEGWALARGGRGEEGLGKMRRALENRRDMNLRTGTPHYLSLVAAVCGELGQVDEGLAALDEGMKLADETGERYYEVEMHRLRGELLLKGGFEGCADAAEGAFLDALELAGRQSARSLGLRAALSLGRLRLHQGRGSEARALIEPRLGEFIEGFETADLRSARQLLEALG